MKHPGESLHYRGIIKVMEYLEYHIHDSDGQISAKADYIATELAEAPSTPMLASQIAELWENYEE